MFYFMSISEKEIRSILNWLNVWRREINLIIFQNLITYLKTSSVKFFEIGSYYSLRAIFLKISFSADKTPGTAILKSE